MISLKLPFPATAIPNFALKWNGLFKKKNRGGGELRTWNFQGQWRKSMWKFHGSIKKVGFPGVFKNEKNSCGIFMSLGFWISKRCFKLAFFCISKVKVTNLKSPEVGEKGGFKKVYRQPHLFGFFWNCPIKP